MSNPHTLHDQEDTSDAGYYSNLPSLNLNSLRTSHTSPVPISPDEQVIRSRGRRHRPCSFSPDRPPPPPVVIHSRHFPSPTRTKSPPKLGKPGPKVRSASRLSVSTELVRRQLEFPPEDNQDFSILKLLPVMKKKGVRDQDHVHASEAEFLEKHTVKKLKTSSSITTNVIATPSPLQLAKALSKPQLLDLLCSLTIGSEHLTATLSELLPKPDLHSMVSNLTKLSQNIYKALPVNRLLGRTDSLAYKQVAIHLVNLKKCLVSDLDMLVDAGQWDSVMEFVTLVWEIVSATPLWDNPVHNTTRVTCFKHMASSVIKVLRHKDFKMEEGMKTILVELMIGSPIREVQLCKEKLLEGRK